MVGDMLLPAHFFGGRGSICGCRTSFCVGRDSSGAALALTFRDRCSIFVPFSSPAQRSPLNVAKRSKMNVRHVFLLQITRFWSTKAVLFSVA